MKKKPNIFFSLLFCAALCSFLPPQFTSNFKNINTSSLNNSYKELNNSTILQSETLTARKNSIKNNMQGSIPSNAITTVALSTNEKASLSRGGQIDSKNTPSSKIELLDWWNYAQYEFSVNSTAVVTDVNTGKSFKIVRTMGSNHADCEALTPKDTNSIKSIWSGFSWDRRPIIININGKKLAASMSAMPHAGIDFAPAFTVINNRSQGYGRGENLDVIKGNEMDGHFDIHFLNSTRHKDGKKDSQHQTAILQAARN